MAIATTGSAERSRIALSGWPLAVGLAIVAVPTGFTLAAQDWSREFGAYGPIVLATGLWLLWRQAPELRRMAVPDSGWLSVPLLLVGAVLYVIGRAYQFITLEVTGAYAIGLAMLCAKVGVRAMAACWFPLVYLAFVIPPPAQVLADLTAPLKEFVSWAATHLLSPFGVPVSRQGVTIFVDQYQLLVEDACSGMNSIVGLTAVSLLYTYLMRGQKLGYSLFMVVLAIPVAVIANIFRIMTLILLTYFFGDAVAQSFLHFTAGMFLFAVALVMVFAIDRLIFAARARLAARA